MSERNKELVRCVIEQAVNRGNLAVADELIATDYVYHEANAGEKHGRDGFRHLVITCRTAFSNVRVMVDQQIAEGDWVATRWTATGTQRGESFGTMPTNKHVTVQGIVISRINDGKIAEEFEVYDALGMLRQLGAVKAWGIAASVPMAQGKVKRLRVWCHLRDTPSNCASACQCRGCGRRLPARMSAA